MEAKDAVQHPAGPRQPSQQRIIHSQMSAALRLRNPAVAILGDTLLIFLFLLSSSNSERFASLVLA